MVGHDTQANDHPLATAIGPQRNGPLHPHLAEEYREWSGGRDWKDDFPEWEPVHRILFRNGIMGIENVGGDIDKVTGKRCHFRLLPLELGPRRRLHRAPGRDRRSQAEIPHRKGEQVLMIVRKLSMKQSPTRRRITATMSRCACSARRWADRRRLIFGISHFQPGGGAGPDASPPEKIYHMLEGELTVIVGGKETVLSPATPVYIAPNENREIINRGKEVCTILVAVAAPPK